MILLQSNLGNFKTNLQNQNICKVWVIWLLASLIRASKIHQGCKMSITTNKSTAILRIQQSNNKGKGQAKGHMWATTVPRNPNNPLLILKQVELQEANRDLGANRSPIVNIFIKLQTLWTQMWMCTILMILMRRVILANTSSSMAT